MRTCCFFGHRNIRDRDRLLLLLNEAIELLLLGGFDVFLFGGYGDFDEMCYNVVTALKQKFNHVKRVYVQAYYKPHDLGFELIKQKYDDVVYPPLADKPQRLAIAIRNQVMIDMSDCCVFHVKRDYGGAYAAMQYAKRKNKDIQLIE